MLRGIFKVGLCPTQAGLDARNEAFDAATVSTGLFIAGGVLAGAGITLVIVGASVGGGDDAPEPQRAGPAPRFAMTLGPGNVATRLSW